MINIRGSTDGYQDELIGVSDELPSKDDLDHIFEDMCKRPCLVPDLFGLRRVSVPVRLYVKDSNGNMVYYREGVTI